MQTHSSSDGFLRDIVDRWQSKEHDVSEISLKVAAYFDKIEVCNPLGSHVKVHKLDK